MFYARKDTQGNFQTLAEHLQNVAKFKNDGRLKKVKELIGLVHDEGKFTKKFADYLKYGKGERGSVVHSVQGAMHLDLLCGNSESEKALRDICIAIICSHHSSLPDCVSIDGSEGFYERFEQKDASELNFTEAVQNHDSEQYLKQLFCEAAAELDEFISKATKNYKAEYSKSFAIGLIVKYLYSCLIDSDRLDAFMFEQKISSYELPFIDWDILLARLISSLCAIKDNSEIGRVRGEISFKCNEAAKKSSGIYQLAIPTGGGKTLSAFRFALAHAKIHNKKRVIYFAPLLSIIEQNSRVVQNALHLKKDNKILLEDHSNIQIKESKDELARHELTCKRWGNQIIISTLVNFLQTIMSSKPKDLRKLKSFSDSVIIFDEIQSLPMHSVNLFCEAVNFLANALGCTVLLCTATLPNLNSIGRRSLLLGSDSNLIEIDPLDAKVFKRVQLKLEKDMNFEQFASFNSQLIEQNRSHLCVVNTKSVARQLFARLKNEHTDKRVFHLSASMCPRHRLKTLNEVKRLLDEKKEKVILVSTQTIEAGVDISFMSVVRAAAGLDSIIQAAGRANRNNELKSIVTVSVVPLLDENLDKLHDIKTAKEITKRVFMENEGKDFLSEEVLLDYYFYYYNTPSAQKRMDYLTGNGNQNVYDLLSTNSYGVGVLKSKGRQHSRKIAHAFASADASYEVIPSLTKSVVVHYKNSSKLVEEFASENDLAKKAALMQKLQSYCISLFTYEFDKLMENGRVECIDESYGIYLLDKDCYSEEIGLCMDKLEQALIY